MSDPATVEQVIASALEAYEDLTALGEEVDDEWTYVTDLSSAWRDRLESVAREASGAIVDDETVTAIALAAEEVRRIEDPHRAIDWLSTFPQIVLLAVGADG